MEDTISRTENIVAKMNDLSEGEWDTSLQVENGKTMIAIHGPDSEVWAEEPFEDAVKHFVDSDDDWLIVKAPAWMEKLEWAIKHIKEAVSEAKGRG